MILYLSDFFIIGSNYGLFIGSILLSITSVNPIHSILSLINTFLTGSIFLVILNLVFFALIFLAVYLGAIAILFLFIVMMLDIKITNESYLLRNSWSFFDILTLTLPFMWFHIEYQNFNMLEILNRYINIIQNNGNDLFTFDVDYFWYVELLTHVPHVVEIGRYMFERMTIAFLLCGLLLFIAMVGAIVVTVEPLGTKFLYQQDPEDQVIRNAQTSYYSNLY